MNNKHIIVSLIIFLLISFFYLAYIEEKQADLNNQKDWWILSFVNPKSESLDFAIENHGDKSNFRWEVLVDKNKIKEGNTDITKGSLREISLSDMDVKDFKDKKISVKVFADGETKEIYKNL